MFVRWVPLPFTVAGFGCNVTLICTLLLTFVTNAIDVDCCSVVVVPNTLCPTFPVAPDTVCCYVYSRWLYPLIYLRCYICGDLVPFLVVVNTLTRPDSDATLLPVPLPVGSAVARWTFDAVVPPYLLLIARCLLIYSLRI